MADKTSDNRWGTYDLIEELGDQILEWKRLKPTLGHKGIAKLVMTHTERYCSFHVARRVSQELFGLPKRKDGHQKIEMKEEGLFDRTLLSRGTRIRTLNDLLKATRTDLTVWKVTAHTVNSWEQGSKGEKGTEITTLFQVKARLERLMLDDVQPVQTRTLVPFHRRAEPRSAGLRKALFIPDTQHGHRWGLRANRRYSQSKVAVSRRF